MSNIYTLGYFVLCGLLLSLSWVGLGDFSSLVFIALVPLFFFNHQFLLEKRSLGLVFFFNYSAFFTWNFCTTFWVYFASPWGSVAAILLNTLFTTCAFMLGVWISKKHYARLHFLPIAAAWIFWEFLHQHWDLSWTWLTLGNVFANSQMLVQWYEITGVLGGSLWILAINFLATSFLLRFKKRIFRQAILVFTLPTLISLFLLQLRKQIPQNNGVNVLVVQPNIDPYTEKFGTAGWQLLMESLKKVYAQFAHQKIDHIILPETAISEDFSYYIQNQQIIFNGIWEHQLEKSAHLQAFQQLTAKYFPKARVLGGMDAQSLSDAAWPAHCVYPSATATQTTNTALFCYQNHNAAFWMQKAHQLASYNKSKLVVGVELFPFYSILYPLFSSWMANLGGTSGTLGIAKEVRVFEDEKLNVKIAPIICYESVYGAFVGKMVQKGANLLYIITNDGWWGNTPGYVQHQAYAQLRAIETRKWIARSANTGISSFIDPLGRSYQKTLYNERTGVSQTIYPNDIQTFYVLFGDYLAYLAAGLLLFYFILLLQQKFKKKLPVSSSIAL